MKTKLGFTLVELMGILVVLGVLLLMTVPSITKTFQNSKDTDVKEYTQSLCVGLRSYLAAEEPEKVYPQTIQIEVLKKAGYIRENIEVPENNENMKCVSINKNSECSLVENCG